MTDEEVENIFNEINMQANEKISLERFIDIFESHYKEGQLN